MDIMINGKEYIKGIKHKHILILILIGLTGLFLRSVSFYFNQYPHHDVFNLAMLTENLGNHGHLWIEGWIWTEGLATNSQHLHVFSQYAPGWNFFSLPFYFITGDGFTAIKALSLLSGIIFLVLVYFLFKELFDEKVALLSLVFCAFSTILVDYSANGSPYILCAAFVLIYVFFLLRIKELNRYWALIFGLFLALSPLVHNILALMLGSFIFLIIIEKDVRKFVMENKTVITGIFMGLSLYLLYHQLIYDTPLPPQMTMAFSYASESTSNGILALVLTKLKSIGFIGYKSIYAFSAVLLPFMAGGILHIWRDFKSYPKEKRIPILGILVYIFIYLLYLIVVNMGFRDFVTLTPLFLCFAALYLTKLNKKELTIFVVLVFIATSMIPLARSPHTYYFPDWEDEYISEVLATKECAEFLKQQERGTVLSYGGGGIELFYYTRFPYVHGDVYPYGLVNSTKLQELIDKHNPMYIYTESQHLDLFSKDFKIIKNKNDFYLLKYRSL